jgi:transposase InsO family protein
MNRVNSIISKIYYNKNHPNFYGNVQTLYKELKKYKITQKQIRKWLKSQDVYTLHHPVKKKFSRNHYLVQNIDQLWEIDLCDLKMFKKYNDDYTFLLTVIDVFSKYAWAVPLKNKTGPKVTKALHKIISESNRKPLTIQSDKGKEFKNNILQGYLKQNNIKQRFPSILSTNKAAVIERFNRTLKEKMFKYFTHERTKRYIDILPNLLKSYNNSYHRTIKMKPIDVNENNTKRVYLNLKKNIQKNPRLFVNIFVDDYVRIVKRKALFEHGYTPKWTDEVFKVYKIIERTPYPLFVLKDLKGKEIEGKFYYQELQKIYKSK